MKLLNDSDLSKISGGNLDRVLNNFVDALCVGGGFGAFLGPGGVPLGTAIAFVILTRS